MLGVVSSNLIRNSLPFCQIIITLHIFHKLSSTKLSAQFEVNLDLVQAVLCVFNVRLCFRRRRNWIFKVIYMNFWAYGRNNEALYTEFEWCTCE